MYLDSRGSIGCIAKAGRVSNLTPSSGRGIILFAITSPDGTQRNGAIPRTLFRRGYVVHTSRLCIISRLNAGAAQERTN